MVRVVRLERTVSWSQTRRDTNFAIPGYSISAIIPRRREKSKIFLSVVIYVVKAAFIPLSAIGGNPANTGVTRLCGVSPCLVSDSATALPNVAPYQLSHTRIFNFPPLYHVEAENQSFSCPRPFLWANSFLHRTRQPAEIPQTQTPQGFPAVRLTQFRILPRCSQAQLSRSVCP